MSLSGRESPVREIAGVARVGFADGMFVPVGFVGA
jgi:hypothetical protein